MKRRKEVNYIDNPDVGELEVISKGFLPNPEDLVFKEETEKITLVLDKSTLEFFREEGAKLGAPYQKMIRNLLKQYVEQYKANKKVNV